MQKRSGRKNLMVFAVSLQDCVGHDDRLLLSKLRDLFLHHLVPHLSGSGRGFFTQSLAHLASCRLSSQFLQDGWAVMSLIRSIEAAGASPGLAKHASFFARTRGSGYSPLTTPDARQSAILSLRLSSQWARRGRPQGPMHSKRRSGKLPNTVLLSVVFRLLYHGSYECGEIRGNHGYRGSVGSFCAEEYALRPAPANISSENCTCDLLHKYF